jgi:hypothetical protein
MKKTILILLITSFAFGGFFNDNSKIKEEYLENTRLCKIFQEKVIKYEKNIRKDVLASATLDSYKHRAKLFCKKAEDDKKEL